MNRRWFLRTTGTVIAAGTVAGCIGSDADQSGTARSTQNAHTFDVEAGQTIRIEAENEQGVKGVVAITSDWDGNPPVRDINEFATETTITHVAEHSEVYYVTIIPDPQGGRVSYQIYIENGD